MPVEITLLGDQLKIDERLIDASIAAIRRQVQEYEQGRRLVFSLGIDYPESFTGRVMKRIDAIPYGETRTYGAVANELDTAPVAVGRACARNPLPVIVPCHRIIGADGALKGYSGVGGVTQKRRLLDHESQTVSISPDRSVATTNPAE